MILQSKDGHALWVSELIMNSTGPLPDEVDGGIIVRDEMKQPTGKSDQEGDVKNLTNPTRRLS